MDGSLSTALILGAVALSEGIRVTPTGAVVLRRLLAGPWTPEEPLPLGRGFTLPSLASPFTVAVVVPPAQADADPPALVAALRDRVDAVGSSVRALRVLGAASLVLLVIGVPLLTARSGWFGLLAALGSLVLLAAAQAVLLHRALRRVGGGGRSAALTAAKVLWPFTTPRSAEILLDATVRGVPPLVVARALLHGDEFHRLVRPLAYDVVMDRDAADAATLRGLCDTTELRTIIAHPPEGATTFCPRCAAGYANSIRSCVECDMVPLVAA